MRMYHTAFFPSIIWGHVQRAVPGSATCPQIMLFLTMLCTATFAFAGDWPQWRGPNFNGSCEETNLPATFSATENVRWTAPLPGSSAATPVISDGRVYVVSNNADLSSIYGICFDSETGKEIWREELVPEAYTNSRNDMGSCSPVADEKRVYFLFGSTDLFALDLDGNTLWHKDLGGEYGGFSPGWGYSSSPMLYEDQLYVLSLSGAQEGGGRTDAESYIYCLDPATGDLIWKHHRPTDAVRESFDAYTTAIPFKDGDKTVIVVAGGDYITGHDAATGEELWRHGNNPRKISNWRLIPSAVVADGLICGVQPRGGDAFAFRPAPKANLKYEEATWIYPERTTDAPTPLYYQGKLYIINGTRRIMTCLDPKTGTAMWSGEIEDGARIWSSPSGGDGKIYMLDEDGEAIVLAAGDEFKVLGRAKMGIGPCKSSIAIAEGKLFIRTADKLTCVANPQ